MDCPCLSPLSVPPDCGIFDCFNCHAVIWDSETPEKWIDLQTKLCDVAGNASVKSTLEDSVAEPFFFLHDTDEVDDTEQLQKSTVQSATPAVNFTLETTLETKRLSTVDATICKDDTGNEAIYRDYLPVVISHKVDRRGTHWAEKVKAGFAPNPSAATKEWAERQNEKEMEYSIFMRSRNVTAILPWQIPGAVRSSGNTKKVIYMELLMHHVSGAAHVVLSERTTDGLFGIVGFSVPPNGRPAFDAGSVPSMASAAGTARKSIAKIWQTSGFRERLLPDGTLLYEYDAAVSEKQRAQQSSKRRRAA
jgi:hypothetical protein